MNIQKIRHQFSLLALFTLLALGAIGITAPSLTALLDDGGASTYIAGGHTINGDRDYT